MKKDVTMVAKNKHISSVLAELGDRTRNSQIFLHDNIVHKLECDPNDYQDLKDFIILSWNASKEYPELLIIIDIHEKAPWNRVCIIRADNISFKSHSYDPDEIFFFQMED